MKKFLVAITLVIFFVPCVSFAQTTTPTTYSPQYIALLQQLLSLLEQELAAIQASNAPITPAATSTPSVTASAPTSLLSQFNSDIASVSTDCDEGTELARCELDEAALTSFLQSQAAQGITSSDQTTETAAINSELSKLESESSAVNSPTVTTSAAIIETRQSALSNETQSLQNDLGLLAGTIPTNASTSPCTGYSGEGLVNGVVMQYACGFPTQPVEQITIGDCTYDNKYDLNGARTCGG